MIQRFRHKGLAALHQSGTTRGLPAMLVDKLELILDRLDVATGPQDFGHGYRLHPLKGGLKGFWAVHASANWRVVFRFDGDDVTDVDLIDYH